LFILFPKSLSYNNAYTNKVQIKDVKNMETIISIENASKILGKRKILDNISLDIKEGEIYGLLGPSGCGKSTTVKLIAGILKPDEGQVKILGKNVPNFEVMRQMGYMTQEAALYPTLSAYDNLKFFGSLYGIQKKDLEPKIWRVAKLVDLEQSMKQPVHNYSGGMKQRLSLAITLLSEPKILLLDEPTVGIDPLLRQKIWKELRNLRDEGVTIIITTHVMDEVEKCDRLSMIREGRILINGSPDDIKKKAGTTSMEEAFITFSQKAGDCNEY
jgi:ABC-2 type transport system ATP-binding protein